MGSDDNEAGKAAGKYLADKGQNSGICVNTLPGSANIEAFCAGFVAGMTEAGGAAEVLPLPASSFGSQTAVAQAVRAHLLQNPGINGVFTVSDVDANAAISGIQQSGKMGQVAVCGINFNETILENIKSGTQACAIDQQGYMQGFLAVSILNANVNYGLTVPTREILTGLGFVDASNVDQVISGVAQGTR
ncbi:substrate-binding domain-containing protein [Thetidibacter halocola]|uniref:Substrate-binding domain-containing protein n=1 Tax=Thetidibacter halocola TaxID=2827239 RepID=A0A8J7WHQ7_9RHOB|nr:substrate-binding domain-containing protein [Thetidibacter halocola]